MHEQDWTREFDDDGTNYQPGDEATISLTNPGVRPFFADELEESVSLFEPAEEPGDLHHALEAETVHDLVPLFGPGEARDFYLRWREIQESFSRDPQQSVEDADALLAEVIRRLTGRFADEQAILHEKRKWGSQNLDKGLRISLRRYESFFAKLLTVDS